MRRLGIINDIEHQAVDDARAQVLGMVTDCSGPSADAERWAAWRWEPTWPTPRLPQPVPAAKRGAPKGITVAYVDRQLRVIDIHTMKPNHIGKPRWRACHALDTVQRMPGIPSPVIRRAG
ncbi:hypothetical protein [Streptomyces flavidovirens]|uniref:Transposase n=1 Tax=Streptomyces flavidovirens TaxID=67298 RepID=A0ABW6RNM7_9ACTN